MIRSDYILDTLNKINEFSSYLNINQIEGWNPETGMREGVHFRIEGGEHIRLEAADTFYTEHDIPDPELTLDVSSPGGERSPSGEEGVHPGEEVHPSGKVNPEREVNSNKELSSAAELSTESRVRVRRYMKYAMETVGGKNIVKMLGVLLVGGLAYLKLKSLIDKNIQTEDECTCNMNRSKDLCNTTAPYTPPACDNCDRDTDVTKKSCCLTCKDILSGEPLDLSFLGTTDVIDLSDDDQCRNKDEETCCSSADVRENRADDLTVRCLFSQIEDNWGYLLLFIIILFLPTIIQLGSFFKSAWGTSDTIPSKTNIRLPFIALLAIIGIVMVVNYSEPDISIYSISAIVVLFLFGFIFIYPIVKLKNGNHVNSINIVDKVSDPDVKNILPEGNESGNLWSLITMVIIVTIIFASFCSFRLAPGNNCKSPPEISITSMSNAVWEEHISEHSGCLNSIDSSDSSDSDSNILDSCISPLISFEGFDVGETPDCSAIDNQYDSTQYGSDKKYYCFVSGCSYDGSRCTASPNCYEESETTESTRDAALNYGKTALSIGYDMAKLQAEIHVASLVATKAVGRGASHALLKRLGEKVLVKMLQKVLINTVTKLIADLVLEAMDPLGWIGLALDMGDPCNYQSFISNQELKTQYRNKLDIEQLTDKSKPYFFQLPQLSIFDDTDDREELPYKIIYRAYISWTQWVNLGVVDNSLNNDSHAEAIEAAQRASNETSDNNYCTFYENYQREYSNHHKSMESDYYRSQAVMDQINELMGGINPDNAVFSKTYTDPKQLKQIQLWKYIRIYCQKGGKYISNSNDPSGIVLYDGSPVPEDSSTIPNLWDDDSTKLGVAIKDYLIDIPTLESIIHLNQNGSTVTLNENGARRLKNILKDKSTTGMPCNNPSDSTDKCIIDDLVINITNKYRNYNSCSGPENCDPQYISLPAKLPLYYPSSSFVNTLCKYSTRGVKWIANRYSHLSPSNENLMDAFQGASETVDNTDTLSNDYLDDTNGLCKYNADYCHRKACRSLVCMPGDDDVDHNADQCNPTVSETDKFLDCEKGFGTVVASFILGDTITCEAENLFTPGYEIGC